MFVSDAIQRKVKLVPELFYSTDDEVRTVVRVMRDNGLLVRIEGRSEDSLEYQDIFLALNLRIGREVLLIISSWLRKSWESQLSLARRA